MRLSYPPPSTSWQQAELPSTALTALVVAILTTIISYQLTALLLDVVLGCKPRNVARVHTFQTLLLSRKASPLALLNAIFRKDHLTRRYFQNNLPEREVISREDKPVRLPALVLLFSLLVAAPVVNIISVILIIEQERPVSFAQANFGAWNLGIGNGDVWDVERQSEHCWEMPIEYDDQDKRDAQIGYCENSLGPQSALRMSDDRNVAGVSVLVEWGATLMIQIRLGEIFWNVHYIGTLKSYSPDPDDPTRNWIVRSTVTLTEASTLVDAVLREMLQICGGQVEDLANLTRNVVGERLDPFQDYVFGRDGLSCFTPLDGEKELSKVLAVIRQYVTLVPAERFDVIRASDLNDPNRPFLDAKNEIFLRRRWRLAGIPVLAIVTVVAVVGRILTGILLNNDVNDGMERLVKERLGLPVCRSLLREDAVVSYNAKNEDENEDRSDLQHFGSLRKMRHASSGHPGSSTRTFVMFDGGVSTVGSSMDQMDYFQRVTSTPRFPPYR